MLNAEDDGAGTLEMVLLFLLSPAKFAVSICLTKTFVLFEQVATW